jgi:hypothetical protein
LDFRNLENRTFSLYQISDPKSDPRNSKNRTRFGIRENEKIVLEIGPEKSRKSEVFSDENLGTEIGPEKSKNRTFSRMKIRTRDRIREIKKSDLFSGPEYLTIFEENRTRDRIPETKKIGSFLGIKSRTRNRSREI